MSKTSTGHLLDPELAPFASGDNALVAALRTMETPPKDEAALRAGREGLAAMTVLGDPDKFGVSRTEVFISRDRGPDVRCLLYVPANEAPDADSKSRPGYLHMHGGGYIFGSPELSDLANLQCAKVLGAVVCSVDYRMGPEDPIPAPLDDCYEALAWFHKNAEKWNMDTMRIAVGGDSAGGGLAAALSILARDKGEYAICHQQLAFPMLDNRTGSEECPGDPLTGEFVWSRAANQFGWKSHLGDAEAAAPQVPARLDDFSNLPSAWILVTGLDLFRDENIAYANALMKAGVPTELTVIPGGPHGFMFIPGTEIGKRYNKAHLSALAKALEVDL